MKQTFTGVVASDGKRWHSMMLVHRGEDQLIRLVPDNVATFNLYNHAAEHNKKWLAALKENPPTERQVDLSVKNDGVSRAVFMLLTFYRVSDDKRVFLCPSKIYFEDLELLDDNKEASAKEQLALGPVPQQERKPEDSGSHCEYYHCPVDRPQNPNQKVPYIANCEDIIQALGLTFDEGCEFKSLWRRGRARQGFLKAETTAVRDAAKAVHYAKRVLAFEEAKANVCS